MTFPISLAIKEDPGTGHIAGIVVTDVPAASMTGQAGVKVGDTVVAFNGRKTLDFPAGIDKGSELGRILIDRPPAGSPSTSRSAFRVVGFATTRSRSFPWTGESRVTDHAIDSPDCGVTSRWHRTVRSARESLSIHPIRAAHGVTARGRISYSLDEAVNAPFHEQCDRVSIMKFHLQNSFSTRVWRRDSQKNLT